MRNTRYIVYSIQKVPRFFGFLVNIFNRVKSVSLREQVVEQIRTAIIEGRLKSNDHIVEKTITEQLGVSRTPVREALILLEREGLIISVPNRGSFVREFTVADAEMLFSMRTTLECFATELVLESLTENDLHHLRSSITTQRMYIEKNNFEKVRSVDMEFHNYLIEKSEHALLIRSWREMVAQIAAMLYIRAEAMPNYDEYLAVRDHGAIVEALATRDMEKVKAEHKRINNRVAGEVKEAIRKLSD